MPPLPIKKHSSNNRRRRRFVGTAAAAAVVFVGLAAAFSGTAILSMTTAFHTSGKTRVMIKTKILVLPSSSSSSLFLTPTEPSEAPLSKNKVKNSPLRMPPLVTPNAKYVTAASMTTAAAAAAAAGNAGEQQLGKKNADDDDDDNDAKGLLSMVRKISNLASLLCVLDCTLLPIVTIVLPLLGVLNLGTSQLQTIDQLGHSLALYFVLPVGSLTTVINYLSHKKAYISALAFGGLILVGLANSHLHVPMHLHQDVVPVWISLDWIRSVLHKIQGCGTSPWHRIVNVSGCAFLLGSNYWSQQQDGACAAHGIVTGSSNGSDVGDCSKGCNH